MDQSKQIDLNPSAGGTGGQFSAAALAQYAHDLAEDVTPYLETVDGLTLRASIRVGEKERPAIQLIGQSVLAHGNVHLGQILTVRAAQGLRVDAY